MILPFNKKLPEEAWKVGLLQATSLVAFISIISYLMHGLSQVYLFRGNDVFAGIVFLSIFAVSALVCGVITLVYPASLALNKDMNKAMRIIMWTAGFTLLLVVTVIAGAMFGVSNYYIE